MKPRRGISHYNNLNRNQEKSSKDITLQIIWNSVCDEECIYDISLNALEIWQCYTKTYTRDTFKLNCES